jgi:hypothetical protein
MRGYGAPAFRFAPSVGELAHSDAITPPPDFT